jgi:hypothetical protein
MYQILTVDGEEYATDNLEEVKEKVKEILTYIGSNDVRIIDDKDYYVKVTNYSNEAIDYKDVERLEQLLTSCGSGKITLSNVGDYETAIVWGKKPEVIPDRYSVEVRTTDDIVVEPYSRVIEEGLSASFNITLGEQVNSFHIRVNDEEFTAGLPDYIKYADGILTIEDIHNDLVVMLIQD